MTDASTTGAVSSPLDETLVAHNKALIDRNVALVDERDAAIQRAEAAEAEREMLKAAVFGSSDYWPSLAIGNFCEMARTTEDARKEAQDQLTAARRAEAAAWNDAIEAAEAAYAQGFAAIRALRRAAPTEGEA